MAAKTPGITRIELKNGEVRYEIRKTYKDQSIHERYRTQEQAKNRLKQWLEEIDSGQYALKQATFKDLANEWLKHKKGNLADHTYRDYESIIKNKIVPRLGHLEVAQIQPMSIQKLIDDIQEKTPRTANKTLTVIRQMFKYAIRWQYCTINPAASVDRAAHRRPTVDVLDEEEAAKLLGAAQGQDLASITG